MHLRSIRGTVAAIATVATVATLAAPAGAAPARRGEFPVAPVVRFEAAPGTVLTVPGLGRFLGTVEVRQRGDGTLTVVNELAMDEYLMGLAEMPASWPMEALKAQAVAGRTYAWYSIALGTFRERGLPYDICPTVDCQVFSGYDFVAAPNGDRWRRAVLETSNEVLVHDGEPILARFFSSSGGHTKDNEDVYGYPPPGSAGPRPYLEGVPDPHDRISPWHRWRLEMTHAEFNAILRRGSTLSAVVPVAKVERVPKEGAVDQLRFTGRNGRVRELSASKFRAWFAEVGPGLFPGRFPGRGAGGKRVPEAMPTSRLAFSFSSEPGVVVIEGRGWGHGVGMSQWGARGKAEEGWRYDDIVAAYYQGLRPQVVDEMPRTVRVGVADSVRSVIVRADGPYRVVQDGRAAELQPARLGWRLVQHGPRSLLATGPLVPWHRAAAPPPPDAQPSADAPAAAPPDVEAPSSLGERLVDLLVRIVPRLTFPTIGPLLP